MTTITLKKATQKDIPALLEIEKSAANLKIYSPILTAKEWEKELKGYEVFLIYKGGEVAGNICYQIKSPNHAYFSGLVVLPRFRGQGIAREATRRVLKKLEKMKKIDLVTHPKNKPALSLYLSLGFKITGREENRYGDNEPRLVLAREK